MGLTFFNSNNSTKRIGLDRFDRSTHVVSIEDGTYTGGYPGGQAGIASTQGSVIQEPTFLGVFLTYAETELLQAEAAKGYRGLSPSDAGIDYNNRIQASIDYWIGVSGISLGSATALIPTTYAFPSSMNDGMKAIASPMWIALYNRVFEAWMQWRRLDYPTLSIPTRYDSRAVNSGVKTVSKQADLFQEATKCMKKIKNHLCFRHSALQIINVI